MHQARSIDLGTVECRGAAFHKDATIGLEVNLRSSEACLDQGITEHLNLVAKYRDQITRIDQFLDEHRTVGRLNVNLGDFDSRLIVDFLNLPDHTENQDVAMGTQGNHAINTGFDATT